MFAWAGQRLCVISKFVCVLVSTFREVTWPRSLPPTPRQFLNVLCAEGSLPGLSLSARVWARASVCVHVCARSLSCSFSLSFIFFLLRISKQNVGFSNHNGLTVRYYLSSQYCQHWLKKPVMVIFIFMQHSRRCHLLFVSEEQPASLFFLLRQPFVPTNIKPAAPAPVTLTPSCQSLHHFAGM